jgi:hypothetical protein
MEDRKIQSLRRVASIAKSKGSCKCARNDKCLPHFGVRKSIEVEKGEKVVMEKILGNT